MTPLPTPQEAAAAIAWAREQEAECRQHDVDCRRAATLYGASTDVADSFKQDATHFAALIALLEGRADLERRLRHWAVLNACERLDGKTPTGLNPWTVLGWMGIKLDESEQADLQVKVAARNTPPVTTDTAVPR